MSCLKRRDYVERNAPWHMKVRSSFTVDKALNWVLIAIVTVDGYLFFNWLGGLF